MLHAQRHAVLSPDYVRYCDNSTFFNDLLWSSRIAMFVWNKPIAAQKKLSGGEEYSCLESLSTDMISIKLVRFDELPTTETHAVFFN